MPRPLLQTGYDRYNLNGKQYDEHHSTKFAIYDLRRKNEVYELYQTRIESSTIDDLFHVFRNNPHIPSKAAFINRLEGKISKNAHIQLSFS